MITRIEKPQHTNAVFDFTGIRVEIIAEVSADPSRSTIFNHHKQHNTGADHTAARTIMNVQGTCS